MTSEVEHRTAELPEPPGVPELPELPAEPVPDWPGEQVSVGGRRLYVRRAHGPQGGEPVVLVHGLGGASTNWTDLMFLLRGRYDCWAPDLPGFGFSDPPPGDDYSLDSHVRAAVRLLEQVVAQAGGPVHLFGNSLGGALTVRLAATRPDLVRTLTLISPAMPVIRPRRGTDPRLILLLVPGLSTWLARASKRAPAEARVREVIDLVYGEQPDIPQVRLDDAIRELERRRDLPWFDTALMASLRGLARSYFTRGERSLWRQAATIQAPTLVLWGRRDRLVSASIAGRVQQTIPNSRLLVLEQCGHVAMLEEPVRVAREFLAFVGR